MVARLRSWARAIKSRPKLAAALSVLALVMVMTTGLCRPALASSAESLNAMPDIRQAFRTPLPELIKSGWTQPVPWCRYKPAPGSFRANVITTLIK